MAEIRYVQSTDKDSWFRLDKHLPKSEFEKKVINKTGYVLIENDIVIGILRYNLFWDIVPFCTLIYIDEAYRGMGYGYALIEHWERDMKSCGHKTVMTSTQSDETAQHFYRKLGYRDSGSLIFNNDPTELFFTKSI